jgi:hypothetical protein
MLMILLVTFISANLHYLLLGLTATLSCLATSSPAPQFNGTLINSGYRRSADFLLVKNAQ